MLVSNLLLAQQAELLLSCRDAVWDPFTRSITDRNGWLNYISISHGVIVFLFLMRQTKRTKINKKGHIFSWCCAFSHKQHSHMTHTVRNSLNHCAVFFFAGFAIAQSSSPADRKSAAAVGEMLPHSEALRLMNLTNIRQQAQKKSTSESFHLEVGKKLQLKACRLPGNKNVCRRKFKNVTNLKWGVKWRKTRSTGRI